MIELRRPTCVQDSEWEALSTLLARIERANRDSDYPLVLGTAKELCEAVAKITYQQRSERFGSSAKMSDLIPGAHRLVSRLPAAMGDGASGGAVRDLAQGAMKIANGIVELRNRAGSGHGHPEPVYLDDIDAEIVVGAALLWCSWILARLDAVVANDPDRLAQEISSTIFYKGDIARRLEAAGVSSMDEHDQRVVGFAIGQRSGPGGTGNVYREGVWAAVESADVEAWPPPYREAVAEGLLTDRNGYISITPSRIRVVLQLLEPLPDRGAAALVTIHERFKHSEPATFVTEDDRVEAVQALLDGANGADQALSESIVQLAAILMPQD